MARTPRRLKLKQELRAAHVSLHDLGVHLVKPYQTIQKWIKGDRPIPEPEFAKAMFFLKTQKTLKNSTRAVLDANPETMKVLLGDD